MNLQENINRIKEVVGDERFPKGLEKSLKHIKNIKNYNESSSL
jgi:hypothetical protein